MAGRKKKTKSPERRDSESERVPSVPNADEQAPREVEAEIVDDDKIGEGETLEAVEVLPADDLLGESEDLDEEAESDSSALVPYDSLTAYMREIRRYRPLTREQEEELAKRYHEEKDVKAAYKLVSSNLWLVVKIARDYERAARNLLDLIQEGNIGLMEAVKNFDPYRGVRFPSYATWWIKAYILRFVISNWRMVKIGTTQAQRKLFFNLMKERQKLEREGFYPGPKLLAEKLNVKESEVVEMEQRLGSADLSVDAPMQSDGDADYLSVLPSGNLSAEELLANKEMGELLNQSLEEFASTLNSKELIIFRERLLSEKKATLQEVAEQFSVSKERIRQIENRLRDKLKEFLLEKLGPSIENFEFQK